jgi:menaquinone reductase, multiheme cytochrome c subunit
MADETAPSNFIFPRWANYLLPVLVLGALGGGLYMPVLLGYGLSPQTLNVGYAPIQPVAYSHLQHAGMLGIDCRYCHTDVDKGPHANIPPTQTCMNCHASIKPDSDLLAPVRQSWETGTPVPWVRVHDLPDYVYFDHSAHVNRGVGCASCHGRVDQMDVVHQVEPLSMAWCLDCHREPEKHLRPLDQITNMMWQAEDQQALGLRLKEQYQIRDHDYMVSCSTCHR